MVLRFARLVFADLSIPRASNVNHVTNAETQTLIRTVRRVALGFAAAWQLAMVLSTFGTLGLDGWPIMAAEVSLAAAALLALRYRGYDPVIPLGMAATGLWSYLASGDIDSALVFAACWQIDFSSCVVGLLVLRRYAVPLVAGTSVAISASILVWLPEWEAQFAIVVVVTQLAIIIAMKWGMATLLGVAATADADAADAADAHHRTHLAEHLSAQLAEESRVLHDTAINTLGAIANGGAGTADANVVREQCARDVELLETLRTQPSLLTPASLREMFDPQGLPIRRQGADDEELAGIELALPPSTVTAVVRCVREALTNATKHSGAEDVVVSASATPTTLTVSVRDSGVGFSRDIVPEGFGIGASILDRARDNGFLAEVVGRPGEGTTVTLTVHLQPSSPAEPRAVRWLPDGSLHVRAGELWGIGVTAVSVVLLVAGSVNEHLALYPMIGLMVAVWLVFRFAPAAREHPAFLVALGVATCAVFLLSATATGFGANGAIHWHALAATGPFILLLSATSNRWARMLAACSWALVVFVVAGSIHPVSATAAQITVTAGAVGIGFSGVWIAFQSILRRLGAQASRSRQDVIEANLRAELDAATQRGYRRWVGAGLDSAIALLRELSGRERDPHEARTRDSCAEEERYLRQIVQISPQFVNLCRELPQTLNLAREQSVSYFLRLGSTDAPNEATARNIASSIAGALAELSPGDELRASLYPVGGGLQLTLLGPGISRPADSTGQVRHERLGPVDLVEVAYLTEMSAPLS